MNTAWSLPDRPLSVKEISDEANHFTYNNVIPLKHWLRAADTLFREVRDLLLTIPLRPVHFSTLGSSAD